MRNSKFVVFGLISAFAVALCTGSVLAAYAITDNASSFGIEIRATMSPRTITFHMPNAEDNGCMAYTTQQAQADYGETLTDISVSVPNTSSFLGFTFSGWYQEDTYDNSFSTSTPIENNMDLYPKYTRNNVLYDGSVFYASSNSDQTVDARYVYKIDTQIWGVVPATNNEIKVDLLSSSGIYKMTFDSNWTILRKVGIHANGLDWLANDGMLMYAYGQSEDTGSWGDVYWGGTPSTSGVSLNGSSAKGTMYIDYSKQYIGVVRDDDNIELGNGSNRPTNSWKPTSLSSGYQYSKDNIYLYLTNSGGNGDHQKDAPSWGNGN